MNILRVSFQNCSFLWKAVKMNKPVYRFCALSCGGHRLKYTAATFIKHFTPKVSDDPDWPRIYRLPRMPIIAALCRLKLYQTIFTGLSVPVCSFLYANGSIALSNLQVVVGVATLACITLFCFTHYFRRLVGLIYFNEETQMVKISHLTFWGRKNTIYVPLQDIVPFTDSNCKATDIFVKLCRYSTKDHLLLSLTFGHIYEKEKFELIFGDLDFLYNTNK